MAREPRISNWDDPNSPDPEIGATFFKVPKPPGKTVKLEPRKRHLKKTLTETLILDMSILDMLYDNRNAHNLAIANITAIAEKLRLSRDVIGASLERLEHAERIEPVKVDGKRKQWRVLPLGSKTSDEMPATKKPQWG